MDRQNGNHSGDAPLSSAAFVHEAEGTRRLMRDMQVMDSLTRRCLYRVQRSQIHQELARVQGVMRDLSPLSARNAVEIEKLNVIAQRLAALGTLFAEMEMLPMDSSELEYALALSIEAEALERGGEVPEIARHVLEAKVAGRMQS